MKIVILTSETPSNVWLVNQILSRHDVVGMVIERRPVASTTSEKVNRRRNMIKRYGWLRTLNKLVFNRVRSKFLAEAEASTIRQSFFAGSLPVDYVRKVPTVVVSNINDAACIKFVSEHGPDVLAVCGTTLLKPSVFTLPPKGTINIHTGITPEYRSADPIFWALFRGEPEKVGVTIHYIDKGIDTGSIIYQDSVRVYADDSLASIYVRCIQRGAELYSRALTDIGAGTVRTIVRSDVVSRAYLAVDLGLVQYLLFRWRFWWMGSRLPNRARMIAASAPEAER